ncbi:MAG: HAD-IA family hydrolase [Nitrospirae bacterium]|nr:HAD-IA family hydrolase [Nitrospirota bacterium]
MLQLLIFDLDGTLADTSRDITDAINYAVGPFGRGPYSVEETKRMVGSGITKLLHSLIPEDSPAAEGESPFEEVSKRFMDYYSKHLLDFTLPYPNVKDTLAKLGRYKKAVLSNKREGFSKDVLRGIGLLDYFDLILGSDSVTEKKPSPMPIIELMERFGVSKDETVIIGDSNYDIAAGNAAGITTIAVTYGFRPAEMLRDAAYLIDDMAKLPGILSEIER